ncbi:MAG: PilT/PilU family type 4a pilus ATPase [Actinomycetota bacterium]
MPNPRQNDPVIDEFKAWLTMLTTGDGSDLHLKVGSPPMIRRETLLHRLDREPVSPEETDVIAAFCVPEERQKRLADKGEVDFAYSLPGTGRYRVNAFKQRGSTSFVFRRMGIGGKEFEDLGIPDVVRNLADESRGLVLVTGPTGSGKTTTLAGIIEHINRTRAVHIVTVEDPIEVLHHDKQASINQREVGQDTESFLTALRAALRQDPDVILIGEMRDTETVRTALQAAETGHLVFSTLHTVDAMETVNRVVDFFPPHQQIQIRLTLAGALRGIVSQRLVPAVDGGLIPSVEILVNTGRIQERIADPKLTAEIHEVMKEGGYYGMMTFDQHLLQLVGSGQVEITDAMKSSTNPHDFQLMLQQSGLLEAGTSIVR